MKQPAIYIITNNTHSVLYIGVTSNLIQRIFQHKEKLIDGFSKRYDLFKLVYFELHEDMNSAIEREKQLREWQRLWKERLINTMNTQWQDLYQDLI